MTDDILAGVAVSLAEAIKAEGRVIRLRGDQQVGESDEAYLARLTAQNDALERQIRLKRLEPIIGPPPTTTAGRQERARLLYEDRQANPVYYSPAGSRVPPPSGMTWEQWRSADHPGGIPFIGATRQRQVATERARNAHNATQNAIFAITHPGLTVSPTATANERALQLAQLREAEKEAKEAERQAALREKLTPGATTPVIHNSSPVKAAASAPLTMADIRRLNAQDKKERPYLYNTHGGHSVPPAGMDWRDLAFERAGHPTIAPWLPGDQEKQNQRRVNQNRRLAHEAILEETHNTQAERDHYEQSVFEDKVKHPEKYDPKTGKLREGFEDPYFHPGEPGLHDNPPPPPPPPSAPPVHHWWDPLPVDNLIRKRAHDLVWPLLPQSRFGSPSDFGFKAEPPGAPKPRYRMLKDGTYERLPDRVPVQDVLAAPAAGEGVLGGWGRLTQRLGPLKRVLLPAAGAAAAGYGLYRALYPDPQTPGEVNRLRIQHGLPPFPPGSIPSHPPGPHYIFVDPKPSQSSQLLPDTGGPSGIFLKDPHSPSANWPPNFSAQPQTPEQRREWKEYRNLLKGRAADETLWQYRPPWYKTADPVAVAVASAVKALSGRSVRRAAYPRAARVITAAPRPANPLAGVANTIAGALQATGLTGGMTGGVFHETGLPGVPSGASDTAHATSAPGVVVGGGFGAGGGTTTPPKTTGGTTTPPPATAPPKPAIIGQPTLPQPIQQGAYGKDSRYDPYAWVPPENTYEARMERAQTEPPEGMDAKLAAALGYNVGFGSPYQTKITRRGLRAGAPGGSVSGGGYATWANDPNAGKAVLTAAHRKRLHRGQFALPGERYPINDEAHARSALSYGSRYASPEEYARIRAAVHARYPEIEIAGETKSFDCGGWIKSVDEQPGRFVGQLIRWGSPTETDISAQKDFFHRGTDLGLDYYGPDAERPLFFHHAMDEGTKDHPRVGSFKILNRADGVWIDGQLDQSSKYWERVWNLIQQGKVHLSTDSAPHLIDRVPVAHGSHRLDRFPILGASVTVAPAEFRLPPVVPVS